MTPDNGPTADSLRGQREALRTTATDRLAAAADAGAIEALRASLLGRSGELTALLRGLGALDAAERPSIGQLANAVRDELETAIRARLEALRGDELEARLAAEALDMTGPGRAVRIGHLHPTMSVERDLREIFHAFGFEVFEGPEIETEAMNFEALNMPPD
ncbi:MAG: phenylalanine--tRNA ligase subunit alpha, partial [Chloroflexota bacterium]|nr:phenylalanine--tRNA ligase subunit alpha [Chloroflexota bacterium]